jgi:hypothetical protein
VTSVGGMLDLDGDSIMEPSNSETKQHWNSSRDWTDSDNNKVEIKCSAEDQADLDVNTQLIQLLLVKVSTLVVLYGIKLIMNYIALEDFICNDQLNHYFPATRHW